MPGEFVKVKCSECKNEQVIFSKSSAEVKCLVCGATLSRQTGGKALINGSVIRTVD